MLFTEHDKQDTKNTERTKVTKESRVDHGYPGRNG